MKSFLQRLGKSFMLPISVLPVVSLLFGIGLALDYSGWEIARFPSGFLMKAGRALIDHIPLLFAVGIPVGLSRERDGSAALSGVAGYLVIQNLLSQDAVAGYQNIPIAKVNPAFSGTDNVFIGILAGVAAAFLYDRYSQTRLPSALSFFSGRRLVPILTVLLCVVLSAALYLIWPLLYGGLVALGSVIQGLGAVGAGIYGFLNRLLIPTGLHHALNAVFWFDLIGINDLGNFWSSNGTLGITGRYMAGYFPVMMFGLPGAALAMYRSAKPERRKAVGSMLFAGTVSAFITGVTEPIEFLFLFLSPLLYFVHSVLTGVSLFVSASLRWTAGFNFSAGFIDWIFSAFMPLARNPLMLFLQGPVFFALYYFTFRFFILRFDLKTPGREEEETQYINLADGAKDPVPDMAAPASENVQARWIYEGLGGAANLVSFDYCATRLRVQIKDSGLINREKIMAAGVPGVRISGRHDAQVIVGTRVQFVADALRELHDKDQTGNSHPR